MYFQITMETMVVFVDALEEDKWVLNFVIKILQSSVFYVKLVNANILGGIKKC